MDIKQLRPADVWMYFDRLSQIPRVSHNMIPISNWLMDKFKKMGLHPIMDQFHNILVRKAATKGLERKPTVALQAHMDMVAAKDTSSKHNFAKDPIELIVKDGWVHANKTTLGADDGIGVAMILAIFADNNLKHGPLEALLTSDEEEGLEGVMKFDAAQLKAQYLINIDAEDDEEICIGCPGSTELKSCFPYKRDNHLPKESTGLRICLNGLVGGHSGMTIAEKRINAIKEIFILLSAIDLAYDIRLINIHPSGTGRNIIPSECIVDICVLKKDLLAIKKMIATESDALKLEFDLEKQLKLTCTSLRLTKKPLIKIDSQKIIGCYATFPNGVFTYNWKYNVSETSSNLSIIEMRPDAVYSLNKIRSPYDNSQKRYANAVQALIHSYGGNARQTLFYPGWLPKPNKLADIYGAFYKQAFHKEAHQTVISGGLEPSFILTKHPEMYGISIGPLMLDVHSKFERLNIESTRKTYEVLTKFLANI